MEEILLTDYERLRLEYNRESFRKELAEKIDNRCANCGKIKQIRIITVNEHI